MPGFPSPFDGSALRDDLPRYPPLLQLLRVTQATVPGPAEMAQAPGSSWPGPTLYVSFTQQHHPDTLIPRDREPCLVDDVNGLRLSPGFYLGRLAGSWTQLPVYEVTVFGPSGSAGPQGPAGATGLAGATGSTGQPGTQGTPGPAGSQGPPGTQGSPGGPPGPAGSQGERGPAGSSGEAGATGSTGQPGTQGSPGATGSTGQPGTQGTPGPAGSTGDPGTQGTTGPTGSAGQPGTQGQPGPAGSVGAPGTQGSPGAVGPQGPVGPTGSQGNPGTQGTTGPVGSTGQPGTQGSLGPVGSTGSPGTQGSPGAPGPVGSMGSPGTQGSPGPVGSTGDPGTRGPSGPTGSTGPQGPAGSCGPCGSGVPLGTAIIVGTQYNVLALDGAGNLTQISPTATSGNVLTSNGLNAAPTFKPSSGGGTTGTNGDSGVTGYTVTGSMAAVGPFVDLPSTGTYLVTCSIECSINDTLSADHTIRAKFYNFTDSADVSSSEFALISNPKAGEGATGTSCIVKLIPIVGAKTIKLYASTNVMVGTANINLAVMSFVKLL